MDQQRSIQVIIPRASQKPSEKPKLKTLSVEEALKFTPITTSVLPAHSRLPFPELAYPGEWYRFTTSSERKSVQRSLDQQDANALKAKILPLLDENSLLEYKFKRRIIPHNASTTPSASKNTQPNLSSTAKMVLDATKIDYKYHLSSSATHARLDQTWPSKKSGVFTDNPIDENSKFKPGLPSVSQSHNAGNIVIQIPAPPAHLRRDDYADLPHSSKRRKLSHGDEVDRAAQLQSQKAQGDAKLLQLQDYLLEIFEAQDRAHDNASSILDSATGPIVRFDEEDEATDFRLSSSTLDRLQSLLKQLVSYRRLSDLSIEHRKRLQELCEGAIENAQTLNLQLLPDASEDDQFRWNMKLRKAENGAASACVVIYTMLGSLQEEGLLSEEILTWLPNVLVNIFENCLIPVVEARPDGPTDLLYRCASAYKDDLKKLLDTSRKLLDLVANICVKLHGAGVSVNATEFLAAKLIFVQNAYNDKGAALGSQPFERIRKQAMTVISRLYSKFPTERAAILDEILSSLDKLPSTSRVARQFKVGDGKNIQLISALFMQLVQTTSAEDDESHGRRKNKLSDSPAEEDSEFEAETMDLNDEKTINGSTQSELLQLKKKSDRLFDNGARSAQEIVIYIVGKACNTTKTGDSPYRNLLDLFVEDLVNVLDSIEWPAAELLLRILAARMIELAEKDKAASNKNMALECLGVMGSSISKLKASVDGYVHQLSREQDGSSSSLRKDLLSYAQDFMTTSIRGKDLISAKGPFAIVVRALHSQADSNTALKSAYGYFLSQYAKIVCLTLDSYQRGDDNSTKGMDFDDHRLVSNLLAQISNTPTSSSRSQHEDGSGGELQLAFVLSILNLGFCRRFTAMVKVLASSFSSEQAQVRSRSLKSVVTMLETDPTLLDRDPTIADEVFRCASDDSAMVRDSALSLIAKFIISKPSLEEKGIRRLLECAGDAKIGVQKRALLHLKDIYLSDSRSALKAAIAQTILQRTGDLEESVAELAKRTLMEVWITPLLKAISNGPDSAKTKVIVSEFTEHLVQTVAKDPTSLSLSLKRFLIWLTKSQTGPGSGISEMSVFIVNVLFESTISGAAEQSTLSVLMVFAEAQPRSIAPQQLSNLRRYLANMSTNEDLFMFKSVVGIIRHVLPHLSSTHEALLRDIQQDLSKSINKLARRAEVDEVMSCLSTIDGVLHNTFRLVKLLSSAVGQITKPGIPQNVLQKLICIAGSFGKHIDLEEHSEKFKQEPGFKGYKGGSVIGHLCDILQPMTSSQFPIAVRFVTLESIGAICQSHPGQLTNGRIRGCLFEALEGGNSKSLSPDEVDKLQITVLRSFQDLYAARAVARENFSGPEPGAEQQELGKLGGSASVRDGDSAISLVTNTVLEHVLRIALSQKGEKALLATKTLASISHQGMIHPKQSTGAFVALETSSDPEISEVAEKAHQSLHQQHESVCEREYMNATQEAFNYQRDVYDDCSGLTRPGFKAKMSPCFDIVKNSGSKYAKKFLSNLIARCSFDLGKADIDQTLSAHLMFTYFITQNLAAFEYQKMEELLHVILQIELTFGKVGSEVQQAIENNLHLTHSELTDESAVSETEGTADVSITASASANTDETLVSRLAIAASAATLLWEARSYLKKQYGINKDIRLAINQTKQAKEATKTPVKVYGITGDRYWKSTLALVSNPAEGDVLMAKCKAFLALMAVDDEVKVAADGDETHDFESANLGPEDTGLTGRKRKMATSAGGTPKKPRGRSSKIPRRSSSVSSKEDYDADYAI